MAYTTIPKPSAYFNTNLYTGNDTADTTITGVGFQSDFTWIKSRTTTENHHAFDAVRGGGYRIYPNLDAAQSYIATTLTSWTSDGFVVGTDDGVNANGANFVSWNWKAGTTSGIATNATTTITPTGYSFNQTNGFSAIAYTGNGVDGAYLPHGLGKSPKVMIVKRLTDAGWNWYVYHASMGNQKYMQLNTNAAISATDGMWYSYTPDTVNMKMSNDAQIGASGKNYIMYCFADVQGYSKMGGYVGNGNTDGTFVYTGFKPAFVMVKSRGGDNWRILDNKRLGYNPNNSLLFPNITQAESALTWYDLLSNGFKLRTTDSGDNTNGENYIFMAFAAEPLVSTNGNAATAR